ncbi:TIR domain-containing protein [Rehaibacterium terrae]|uniref:TIR domain-containing protein n=1 Tax=Rehaibacterium terrae TaxID=1341696 RepID=UPI003919CCEE
MRYRAFISYSHRDARWARWLHRALEGYAVPRRLVGAAGEFGPVPSRLRPVFRDRDELASAADLGQRVKDALVASEALVVICSPAAATSRWVNQEVLAFRRLGRDARLYALIVDGEPNTGDARECFPPALRDGADGLPPLEPIAADARPGGDGHALARLKLLAGLLGVELDALRQREAQRRHRRMLAVVAASLAGMMLTGWLAWTASVARDDARRRQDQAEDLIEFMLTDLKERLEGLQRLDVLDAAADKAREYFDALPPRDLDEDALARSAQALRQLGDLRMRRGQWDEALAAFVRARDIDAERLARAPDDTQRIFDLAQSEFWVGNVHFRRSRFADALRSFQAYRDAAAELLRRVPGKPEWLMELGYAHVNLASAHGGARNHALALDHAERGVHYQREAIAQRPDDVALQREVIEAVAWLGTIQGNAGQLHDAWRSRVEVRESWEAQARAHPGDLRIEQKLAYAWRGEATALLWLGRGEEALAAYGETMTRLARLVAHDPDNAGWARVLANASVDHARAWVDLQRPDDFPAPVLARLQAMADPLEHSVPEHAAARAQARALLAWRAARMGEREAAQAQLDSAWRFLEGLRAAHPQDTTIGRHYVEVALLRQATEPDWLSPARVEMLEADVDDARLGLAERAALARLWIAAGRPDRAQASVDTLHAQGFAEAAFLRACRHAGLCTSGPEVVAGATTDRR